MNLPRFVALITAVALLAAPLAAHAQQAGKVYRVGGLWLVVRVGLRSDGSCPAGRQSL